ncbi:MAG: hypothetical protein HYV75_08195, partial [Opitutae bacterium]|nr:hypothetical protein [Opitutae bacterium]
MKPILRSLRGLAVVAALTSGLAVDAQTVQFFSLQKGQNFVQTDATTVTVMPLNPTFDLYPWRFESDINGTGLDASNPTPPNTVTTPTTPIASLVTSYNLTPPDVMGHGWQYRPGY